MTITQKTTTQAEHKAQGRYLQTRIICSSKN